MKCRRTGNKEIGMRRVVAGIWVVCAMWAAPAAAEPVAGPREDVDQRFTTTRPHSPTGGGLTASYHAAGDRKGNPPYLYRMVVTPPRGMRYDTSVPEQCTAPDPVLEALGPDACPAGSRLGGGTAEGIFYQPIGHAFEVDHYKHNLHVLNNANEQIVLVESEGYTVVRGRLRPDGSFDFHPTTCFPAPPGGMCADDYILQLKTANFLPAYTKRSGGRVRSYATTPRTCPASGSWSTTLRFWWSDGSADRVVSRQPCSA